MKAHIISKTLFKKLFEDFDRVHLVKPSDLESRNIVQDSLYDTGILCVDCDNSFSPFEDYFVKLIRGELSGSGILSNGTLSYGRGYSLDLYSGVDHFMLRMFFLITIWRCSVSKQKSFSQINLEEAQDQIKQQIRSGKLTSYENLPAIIISLQDVDDLRKYTVTTPILMSWEGCRNVVFMVTGWMFVYCLDNEKKPGLFEYCLKTTNDFKIIRFDQKNGVIFLDKITGIEGDFRIKPESLIEKVIRNLI